MDTDEDDKSILGKTADTVKEFAATVSEAAHKAVTPEPVKSDEEITVVPAAPTGFMDDAVTPTPVVIRRRKRLPKKSQSRATKRTAKKAKSPKKAAKKSAAKSQSSSVRKMATKKAKTSSSRKKTKKSKR
jgi:hypothetical protein